MTIDQTYGRFVSIVRRRAPECPIQPETRAQETRAEAGRAATLVSALADGLRVSIPGGAATSVVVSGATANSGPDVANAAVDTAVSTGAGIALGAEAGPLVGGVLMVMRGSHQALERSDQVVTYLLGIGGYVNCLARSAINAVNSSQRHISLPTPIAPSYVERMGDLFSRWRRQAWNAGYWRVNEVIREIDNLRPVQGDLYSKQCLIQLAMEAGHRGGRAEGFRIRIRCEDYIMNQILSTNMRAQANALRRWANAP